MNRQLIREVIWWIGWILLMSIILGSAYWIRSAYAEGSRGIIERPVPPVSREDVWGRPHVAAEDPQNYGMEPHPIDCRFFPWPIDQSKLTVKGWWLGPFTKQQWWIQEYDHTGDGKVDTIVLTAPLDRFPTRYGFDVNGDEDLDWLYQDEVKDGQCHRIRLLKQPKPGPQT